MRFFLLVAIALAGCRPSVEAAPLRLRLAVWNPLEPVTPKPPASFTGYIQDLVFQPIARVDGEGRLSPVLARTITRLDPTRFRVVMRDDIRFNGGGPLRREDVVESLDIAGLRAQFEDGAFIVTSKVAGFPVEPLLSRAMIAQHEGGRYLGSGPFAVAEQDAKHIVLVRTRPEPHHVAELSLISFATPREAFAHTLKGDADLLPEVDVRWVEFFEGVSRLHIVRGPSISSFAIAFAPKLPREERIELVNAISTDEVRREAFGDECPRLPQRPRPSLPKGKLDILSVAGFERFALASRRALGNAGGEMVMATDVKAFFSELPRYPLAISRYLTWPAPMLALSFHSRSPQNISRYSNPEVDAAFDAGDWQRARELLKLDPPAAFVCTRDRIVVVDARVKNPTLGVYNVLETLPEWEMGE